MKSLRYHRRFIEVANSVYISRLNSEQRTAIFQNMIDFYKETWKGKNKPFKIDNPNLVNKYGLGESEGRVEADRLITSQPVEFIDINGSVQFNRRKLNELPKFICNLSSNLSIPLFADEILFNYRFMCKFDSDECKLRVLKRKSLFQMRNYDVHHSMI